MWGTPLRRVTGGGQGGRQPRANTEPKRLIEARPRWAGLERQKVPLRNGTEQEAVVFQIAHRTGDLSDGERRQRSADTVKVHPSRGLGRERSDNVDNGVCQLTAIVVHVLVFRHPQR